MCVLHRFDACSLGIPILAEELTIRPVVEEVLGRDCVLSSFWQRPRVGCRSLYMLCAMSDKAEAQCEPKLGFTFSYRDKDKHLAED